MKNTNGSGPFTFRVKKSMGVLLAEEKTVVAIVAILLSFLLPRSMVYGSSSPFAIGMIAAASGAITIPIGIAVFIGYLTAGSINLLRYLAALITVVGIRWSVSGFPRVHKSVFYPPTVTFISMLITGSALLITEKPSLIEVVYIFSECVLAAGFSYFCRLFFSELSVKQQSKNPAAKVGVIAVFCVSMMSLFTIEWQSISLGRIVAALCILLCSVYGGVRGGCIVGCVLGLVAFLNDPSQLHLIPVYTFGGLLSGMFSKKRHWLSAVMLALVNVIVFSVIRSEIDYSFVVGLYEIVAAAVFLPIIPASTGRYIRSLFLQTEVSVASSRVREAVSLKMKKAASSMAQVAGTVDAVSRKLSSCGEPSIGSMYKRVTDLTCDRCKKRTACWECHFSEIMDSFNHLTPVLNQNGTVEQEQLTGFLKNHCSYPSTVCNEVNNAYKEFLVRDDAFRRLHELRRVINDQFDTIADILMEFSDKFELPEWNDSSSSQKIQDELLKKQYLLKEVHCRIVSDGHMEIHLSLSDTCSPEEIEDICQNIGRVCERTFSTPTVECGHNCTDIYLSEGQVYRAVVEMSQLRCKGEKLCGDAAEVFRDDGGNQFVVLSDGMGSGGRAAVDGALTAGITAQLLKSGFGYESVLHIVNTALMTRENDETLATLDIACVNLFTGDLELLKAGAGPSLLLSKGRVSLIDDSSLPLGILRELTFARTQDRLVAGDILLLMSDGISNDGLHWVEELLLSFDARQGNLRALSKKIAETAQKICGNGRGDDMTVIAVKLEKIGDDYQIL